MLLPTDTDYQEAIQNPEHVFIDHELRNGQPELVSQALLLPKARSGSFGVAYRMDCGLNSWAVKCFTRAIPPDLQVRYEEISKHLMAKRLSYTVGFDFICPRGIRIGASWFPILKMQWIDGESIVGHVQRNLGNPRGLAALAVKWMEMVRSLRDAGIAHGDLQHGNILVLGGQLKLIDYDGMYVPALAGRDSHESGHRNYQHPGRNGSHFGPYLDNFSAWAIYVSLVALSADTSLWQRLRGGDETLILREADFANPTTSAAIQALEGNPDRHVRALVGLLRQFILLPIAQVPPLDGSHFPAAAPPPSSVKRSAPNWISDLRRAGDLDVSSQSVEAAPASGPGRQRGGPSWRPRIRLPAVRLGRVGVVAIIGSCLSLALMFPIIRHRLRRAIAPIAARKSQGAKQAGPESEHRPAPLFQPNAVVRTWTHPGLSVCSAPLERVLCSHKHERTATIPRDSSVKIVEAGDGGWYRIQYEAPTKIVEEWWAFGSYLKPSTGVGVKEWKVVLPKQKTETLYRTEKMDVPVYVFTRKHDPRLAVPVAGRPDIVALYQASGLFGYGWRERFEEVR